MKLTTLAILSSIMTTSVFGFDIINLGSTRLMDKKDKDLLILDECRPGPMSTNKEVRAIKLRIENRAAEIDRIVLTYGNGDKDPIQVREFYRPGEESRWIDLPNIAINGGETRCIRSIKIVGDSQTYVNSNLPMYQTRVVFLGLR